MTNQGPFRAPDEVLKLEDQLKDAKSECEDLRRECDELASKLRRTKEYNQFAAGEWTARFIAVAVAAVVISIAYFVWRVNMRSEDTCRDAFIKSTPGQPNQCPYAGQSAIQTPNEDTFKCTCPTAAPVGSAR